VEHLALHLALNGVAVLTVSAAAGLVLWRVLYHDSDGADWHLVHASGSVRGVFLIALAAIIDLPTLPERLLAVAVWLIILFTWTSLLAMIIRAFTGERGFHLGGSKANSTVFALYVIGAVALFPGCTILIVGIIRSL
jgi:hypothetical protein